MQNWKMTNIADCSTILGDGLHGTPKYDEAGEYAFINGNNLDNGHIAIKTDTKRVGRGEYEKYKKDLTDRTVLVSINGTLGNVAVYNGEKVILGKSACYFNVAENCDVQFMRYVVSSPRFKQYINSVATGTTIKNVSLKQMREYAFPIPDLAEQKRISRVLYALDQKIDTNRQINDNLQQQLATIYKSWYQEFSRISNEKLVETEYSMIPKGWHYTLLGDLCQSISVTHKFDKEELIFLNTGDVEDGRFLHSDFMAVKDMPGQAKKTIAPGDILYSEIRPINRHFAFVNFPSVDYVVSTKLMVIRAKSFDAIRLYHYLTSDSVLSELQLQAESRSGTFPQIRFDNISRMPILIADEQTESDFIELLHTVYAQIEHINSENEKLSKLRDNLLPKLMSGEIDVSNVEI